MKTLYAIYFAIVFLAAAGCGDNTTDVTEPLTVVQPAPDAGTDAGTDVSPPSCIFWQDTSYVTGITTVKCVCDGATKATACYDHSGATVVCP
jgi:hypothetical protein